MIKTAALLLLLLAPSACTYDHVHIDLAKYHLYQGDSLGHPYETMGMVNGSARSWAFSDCKTLAIEAIKQMLDDAREMGANAVYNVRFYAGDRPKTYPTCKVYILLLTAVSSVSGEAAHIEDGHPKADAIMLPKGIATAALAERYVVERL